MLLLRSTFFRSGCFSVTRIYQPKKLSNPNKHPSRTLYHLRLVCSQSDEGKRPQKRSVPAMTKESVPQAPSSGGAPSSDIVSHGNQTLWVRYFPNFDAVFPKRPKEIAPQQRSVPATTKRSVPQAGPARRRRPQKRPAGVFPKPRLRWAYNFPIAAIPNAA